MPDQNVTQLLVNWGNGDRAALDALAPMVYDELRRLAQSYLRRERADHTLQGTALVNEAYLRLVDQRTVQWQNRAHFFGVAAQMIRRILVDHARGHQAAKRGAGAAKLSLDEALAIPGSNHDVNLVNLDEALELLNSLDPRQARIIELRYFTGLSIEETGEVIGISPATVKREWTAARAWLYRELSRAGGAGIGAGQA
jgi:RNA polymerase sigma factor (TIGR02999 family)